MMPFHKNYFVNIARRSHRQGLALMRAGLPGAAFSKFCERDIMMERAREDKWRTN
jgi:hypothetical protein